MRVQWKMILLVALVLTGTLTAVVWKTRELVHKDKLSFMADAAMKQMAPLKRLVSERLEDRRTQLVNFATLRFQSSAAAQKKMPADFDVIALVRASAGGEWTPVWSEKNPSTNASKTWPSGYDLTLLKSLPFARIKDGETVWARLSDQQGLPVYAIVMAVEVQNSVSAQSVATSPSLPETTDYDRSRSIKARAILAGFTSSPPFADIGEDYIGSTTTVYVVDDKGYVVSHVNKAFLGALFSEDPIVSEIITQRKTAASGTFEDIESRSVLGHFERIDGTNLYAVATMPLAAAQDFLGHLVRTILGAGFSFGVLGLILAWFLGRSLNRQPEISNVATAVSINDDDKEDENEEGVSVSEETKQDSVLIPDQQAAFEEGLFEGFTNAAKEPLLAILGHAQLIKVKASADEAVRDHAESIEREARRAKDVFDRLREWKGRLEPDVSGEEFDMNALVEEMIAARDTLFKTEEVELSLDLHEVPRVHGSRERIAEAIGHLIDNAIEAMRARNPKKLEVQLDLVDDSLFFVVRDNGVGMTRDVSEKAFDPFFKAYQSPKRMGLGLTFVRAAVASMKGACALESLPGEGTTVRVSLPVSAAEKEIFRREQEEKLIASVADQMTPMPEMISEEPVASLSDHADLDLGELDDSDDDVFTSVAIGGVAGPVEYDADEERVVEAGAGGGASGFHVKIRGPKAKELRLK